MLALLLYHSIVFYGDIYETCNLASFGDILNSTIDDLNEQNPNRTESIQFDEVADNLKATGEWYLSQKTQNNTCYVIIMHISTLLASGKGRRGLAGVLRIINFLNVKMHVDVFFVSLWIAWAIVATVAVFTIAHILTSYRSAILAAYRGDYRRLFIYRHWSNARILSKSMDFMGYQTGYVLWSKRCASMTFLRQFT